MLIEHSLPILRLELSVAKGRHPCVHRVLGKSEHCLVSVKWCREMNHWCPKPTVKTFRAQLWLMQFYSQVSRPGKLEDISLLQNSETLVITIRFAHTGWPSSAPPLLTLLCPVAWNPHPLQAKTGSHPGSTTETGQPVSYTRWSSSVKIYFWWKTITTATCIKMFAISFLSTKESYLLYRQPAIAHK